MTLAKRILTRSCIGAVGLLWLTASAIQAASINYGNFNSNPPGTMFLNVTESSGTDAVPLYGPPTFIGSDLGFSPLPAFSANANGGTVDLTDGQLNYTIMSSAITTVNAQEGGVYTLSGIGTASTSVFAALSLRATVTEINGVTVAPIVLTPSGASASFNLIANPGANNPWALATSVNVAGQLASLGYGRGQNATKVDVVIDNQLAAVSQQGTTASISKTSFGVPEPSTFALGALGACCAALATRKRD